jgi:hypothetical protein
MRSMGVSSRRLGFMTFLPNGPTNCNAATLDARNVTKQCRTNVRFAIIAPDDRHHSPASVESDRAMEPVIGSQHAVAFNPQEAGDHQPIVAMVDYQDVAFQVVRVILLS